MKAVNSWASVVCVCAIISSVLSGTQGSASERAKLADSKEQMKLDILKSVIGIWEGECRTWFRPGQIGDESKVRGEFNPILGGRFVRHTYEGTMQGKPRTGEETIAFNAIDKTFQVSWFDDFHMNYAIMFSEGVRTANGFTVTGKYSTSPGQPPWGWKTVFELLDDNHLTITAYNISPDGKESKAVETVYERQAASE